MVGLNDRLKDRVRTYQDRSLSFRLDDFFYLAFASQAKLDQLSNYLFSIAALITVVYSAFWTVVNCTHFFFRPITYLTDCSPAKVAISFEIAVTGNVSNPFFLHFGRLSVFKKTALILILQLYHKRPLLSI